MRECDSEGLSILFHSSLSVQQAHCLPGYTQKKRFYEPTAFCGLLGGTEAAAVTTALCLCSGVVIKPRGKRDFCFKYHFLCVDVYLVATNCQGLCQRLRVEKTT